jgi:hypothetical protein
MSFAIWLLFNTIPRHWTISADSIMQFGHKRYADKVLFRLKTSRYLCLAVMVYVTGFDELKCVYAVSCCVDPR